MTNGLVPQCREELGRLSKHEKGFRNDSSSTKVLIVEGFCLRSLTGPFASRPGDSDSDSSSSSSSGSEDDQPWVLAEAGSADSDPEPPSATLRSPQLAGTSWPGAGPVLPGRPPTLKQRLKAARKKERREQREADALLDEEEERAMEGDYPVQVRPRVRWLCLTRSSRNDPSETPYG